MSDKVLTANRLSDGISVWLDAAGHWVESLQDAFIARHSEAVSALESAGMTAFADNKVVDVNVIDVVETEGVLRPLRLRERIRAEGPTIDYAPGYSGLAATGQTGLAATGQTGLAATGHPGSKSDISGPTQAA